MAESCNKLNEIMDPFFEQWAERVIAWFDHAKANYRAEYKTYWDKFAPGESSMRPTKESNAAYDALKDKWMKLLGYGWYVAVTWEKRDTVVQRVHKSMAVKKAQLIAKVEAKTGYITEVDLCKGEDGGPNGLVVGDKGRVYVETISAGGWNIQCFHYRVLVKGIKEKAAK